MLIHTQHVINRRGQVFRTHGIAVGVRGMTVGGSVNLTARDARASLKKNALFVTDIKESKGKKKSAPKKKAAKKKAPSETAPTLFEMGGDE